MFEIIRFWDCTICQDNLKAVIPILLSQEAANVVVEGLSGKK